MHQRISFSVRQMSADDLPTVLQLWASTPGIGLNESDTPAQLKAYLQRNAGLSFVATDQAGQIVGAVLSGHDGRRGYLHHLAVAGTHRNAGIGRALVQQCLDQLAELGIKKANIFVFADNQQGQEFWTHLGWKTRPDLLMLQTVLSTPA